MANMINSLEFNNNVYAFTLPYGVCSTAAGTAAKTVTVDNFSLEEGATVIVKFANTNSASSPTLNVNSTGAKPICRYGTSAVGTGQTSSGWRAGAVQVFTYDGTSWVRTFWENTTYSNASLGSGYSTCSTAAATAAKTASITSYALTTGGIVSIKFTYDVPANATLNITSKGAKPIYYQGAAITAGIINAGDTATFIYDGTRYQLLGTDITSDTVTTLSSADSYIEVTDKDTSDNYNYEIKLNENALKTLIGSETTAAMDFKGVTATLPTTGVKGDMYKVTAVITVSTTNDAQGSGFTTKSGDAIICEGTVSNNLQWWRIPAGDDIEDTWRTIKVNDTELFNNVVNANNALNIQNGTSSTTQYAKFTVNNKEVKAEVKGFKPVQTEVQSPNTDGSALAFIDTITQDSNGVITATKKNVEIGDGTFSVHGSDGLTGYGYGTANQKGDSAAVISIADEGVTTAKIAAKAVTKDKIANDAIYTKNLVNYSVTTDKLDESVQATLAAAKSAVQSISNNNTTTNDGDYITGLKVGTKTSTGNINIEIDGTIEFIFDGGTATDVI